MLSLRIIPVRCLVDLGMDDVYSFNTAGKLCSQNLIQPHDTALVPGENGSHARF